MGAAELLFAILAAGFRLRADGDRVIIAPISQLTSEQLAVIRAHKPGLLAILDPVVKRMGMCADCNCFAWRPPGSPAVGWMCGDCLATRSEP